MHILIATTGVLSPGPAVDFTTRLVAGRSARVTVTTVIEVPRSFLEELDDDWHPLDDGEGRFDENSQIERYVEERGTKITAPVIDGLHAAGVEAHTHFLDGADPAKEISVLANELDVDLVILGATRQIFDGSAWESVSARVITDANRPVLVLPAPGRDQIGKAEDDD